MERVPYINRIIDGVPYKAYDAAVWINAKQRQMLRERHSEPINDRSARRQPKRGHKPRDKEWE